MKGNIRAMEAQAPGSRSYLNEVRLRDFIFDEDVDAGYKASLYKENVRETFFWSHYDRLKKILKVLGRTSGMGVLIVVADDPTSMADF